MSNGSGKSSTESNEKSSKQGPFLASLAPISLMPLSPPAPPRFPTLFELAGETESAPPERQQKELFESLISDPLILFQAVVDDPDRYEEGLSDLLVEVINGRQSLDTMSRGAKDLLNRAVVDFATQTHTPKRKVEQAPAPHIPSAVQAAMSAPAETHEIELPATPPSFWWTRTGAERSRTD